MQSKYYYKIYKVSIIIKCIKINTIKKIYKTKKLNSIKDGDISVRGSKLLTTDEEWGVCVLMQMIRVICELFPHVTHFRLVDENGPH